MPEENNPLEGATPAPTETPTDPAPADNDAGAAPQNVAGPQSAAAPLEGEGPQDLGGIPDALAETPDPKPAEGAPETYTSFTDVTGKEYTPESVKGFVDAAREVGLSQEKAQKMFQAFVPTAYKYMHDDVVEKAKGWVEASKNDAEFGGARFAQSMGIAKQAYSHFASDELKQILNATGLSNHPEIIRMFYRVGLTMQQDHGVQGGVSAPATPRRRYPNSNMVVDE